ncbi:hypothetical protein ACFL5K_00760 [Gemmatimonadota bacterium]
MNKLSICTLLIAALTVAVLTGCVTTKFLPAEGAKSYPPTEQIRVMRDSPPENTYEVLGIVAAEGTNEKKLLEKLKIKAMSVGADGLILRKASEISAEYASERHREFSSYEIRYEGIAIRFKNPEVK